MAVDRPGDAYADKTTGPVILRFMLALRHVVVRAFLIAFVIIYTLVGMRNFDVRMAGLHEDDGPIFYAYAFKDPTLFEGDFPIGFPVALAVPMKVATSAMVWIPALLWRYLHVDPHLTTWLITMIQGLSIGLAIYVLTCVIVQKRSVAALAAIFAYIATPWNWNLANFGANTSWNFLPYAANLAIAPVLLAFASLLRGRIFATLLLLSVAGLIHPGLTLHACAIVGLYWLWEGLQARSPATLRRLVGLLVVGIIISLPAQLATMALPGAPLPQTEIIAGMRQNQHIWPWSYAGRWDFAVHTTLKWLLLALLSWRWRSTFSRAFQRLWLAALIGAAVLGLSQVLGAVWHIPLLLNLLGLRAFTWLALLSLPLVVHYWYAHIRTGNWTGAVLSVLCLALPLYAREYALFWPLIIGLLLVDVAQGHLAVWKVALPTWGQHILWGLATGVLLAWGAAFLLLPFASTEAPNPFFEHITQLTWGVLGALPGQAERVQLLVIIALLGMVIWVALRLTAPTHSPRYHTGVWPAIIGLFIVLYGSRFVWIQWQAAENLSTSSRVYTLEVQLWAREHTPPSALFVVPEPGGWRTMSLRRKLSPFTRESYAYVAPRAAKAHRDQLLAFYGISAAEAQALRGAEVSQMELNRFRTFKEYDLLRFATEFGATYLVLPTSQRYKLTDTTAFDLPLVYENPYYAVYRLDASVSVTHQR